MSSATSCPRCGFRHQCICDWIPQLTSSTQLVLLMHENELSRDTNTGKLLQQSLDNCHAFTWQRKTPPAELIAMIEQAGQQAYLLFPSDRSLPCHTLAGHILACMPGSPTEATGNSAESHTLDAEFAREPQAVKPARPLFIILDATWQEAKKMLNKSAWLNALTHVHLTTEHASRYSLRRNQDIGNLCTCEVGIQLLMELGEVDNARKIERYFEHYIKVFQADKSGHKLKL